MFPIDKFWEEQKIYLWETWKKHIMCFSDFSFRNTFCVSMGKTLWKSQNMSLNGFFQGKHHPAPAVAQAYVQGASWAHEYQLEDVQYPRVWEWISQSSNIVINKVKDKLKNTGNLATVIY